MSETDTEARRLATDARDRVRFEEEALALSDQVYRVARHLARSRDEAEDLVQETYARAFLKRAGFARARFLRSAAYPNPSESAAFARSVSRSRGDARRRPPAARRGSAAGGGHGRC